MSVYTYNIPAGTFQKGTNTIIISVASGQSGEGFLSPNFVRWLLPLRCLPLPRANQKRCSTRLSFTTEDVASWHVDNLARCNSFG